MTDLDAFLEALETTADAHGCKVIMAVELAGMIREARANLAEQPAPPEHWSPWLDWHGGPCPLPPGVDFEIMVKTPYARPSTKWTVNHHIVRWQHTGANDDIVRFRYRCAPDGWLPRGDWIPPAELWRDDCPVRCEWTWHQTWEVQPIENIEAGRVGLTDDEWGKYRVTHIRLVARRRAGL